MGGDNEPGVGVKETAARSARGMTERSVRKRQQPPSLERQVTCYADKNIRSTARRWATGAELEEPYNGPLVK